jgi:hypothetical protein
MIDPDKPLREQIAQAMAKIERELEILQGPSTIGGPADNRQVIAELQAEYQALKDARAHLGPHELPDDPFE